MTVKKLLTNLIETQEIMDDCCGKWDLKNLKKAIKILGEKIK